MEATTTTPTVVEVIKKNTENDGGPVLPSEVWDRILEPLSFGMRFTAKSVCRAWCDGAIGDHNAAYVKRRLEKVHRKRSASAKRKKDGGWAPSKSRRTIQGLGEVVIVDLVHFVQVELKTVDDRIYTHSESCEVDGKLFMNYKGAIVDNMQFDESWHHPDDDILYAHLRGDAIKLERFKRNEFQLESYRLFVQGTDQTIRVPRIGPHPCEKIINDDLQPIHDLCRALARAM